MLFSGNGNIDPAFCAFPDRRGLLTCVLGDTIWPFSSQRIACEISCGYGLLAELASYTHHKTEAVAPCAALAPFLGTPDS